MTTSPRRYAVKLTQAQRRVIAELVPKLADRLKLDESPQRTIQLALDEIKAIQRQVASAVRHAGAGMKRNSLRHVADIIVAVSVDLAACMPAWWSASEGPAGIGV
jgi:hypothetical protein